MIYKSLHEILFYKYILPITVLDMVITVSPKSTITQNMIKKCEDTYHLTSIERIMSNPYGNKLVATNRFKLRAIHMLAYISACNDGIVMGGSKYMPETVTNHSSICSNCGLANCRSSKKKPCKSNTRCSKCSGTGHQEIGCKNPDFCINCQKFGHRCNNDGHCPVYQQKTFDNNAFLIPVWVGEGIKTSKYAILRNSSTAIENAKKEEENGNKATTSEAIIQICENFCQQAVFPRVASLEAGQMALHARCDQTDAVVAGIIKTQKEQTDILNGLQTAVSSSTNTVNQVNTNVTTMMDMLARLSAGIITPAPMSPPGNA